MTRTFAARVWRCLVLSAILIAAVGTGGAHAATVEQHPAVITTGDAITALPGAQVATRDLSTTPLGGPLTGIVIYSKDQSLGPASTSLGVVIRAPDPALQGLASVLTPFLQKPLTQELIGEIRDAIVLYLRQQHRPLVAVIVPPQEVTGGTLQLQVIPFTLGQKRVERVTTGYTSTDPATILKAVRAQPGDPIDSRQLLEDMNWLALNPHRQIGVVFEPGSDVGTTNLVLRLSDQKPWSVYSGFDNSGTTATGIERLFFGFNTVNLPAPDQQIAVQATVSPNTIYSDGQAFNFGADASYQSLAASYFAPLPWRNKLTLSGDVVHSRALGAAPFLNDSRTAELNLDYAVPIDLAGPLIDLYAASSVKRQSNQVEFAGVPVGSSTIDVFQLSSGMRGSTDSPFGHTKFDVGVVYSPGGVLPNNTDAAFQAASGDPTVSARYSYARLTVENHLDLPAGLGFNLALGGQLASTTLPAIEKLAIGGATTVRGYETGEKTGDDGYYVQSEFRLPKFDTSAGSKNNFDLSTFGFFDLGQVYSTAGSGSLASTGIGADAAWGDMAHGSLSWAYALLNGTTTTAGNQRIVGQIVVSY